MPSPTLLCLHGWGGSKESFLPLRNALRDAPFTILTPDLPGFGAEKEPDRAWSIDDYAQWVEEWIRAHAPAEAPLLLLGHSHGGRIALKMAVRGILPITHLYLCAAAGIPHPAPVKHGIGLVAAKMGKAILSIPGLSAIQPIAKKSLYRLFGVHDYEKASPVMRETMNRVKSEDLRPLLSQIHIPTDLFWGTLDSMTPVADGHLMRDRITGSTLHLFPETRHDVHKKHASEIARVLRGQFPA